MKKTYINPTTEVIEIEVCQMLAASDKVPFGGGGDGGGAEGRFDEDDLLDIINQ